MSNPHSKTPDIYIDPLLNHTAKFIVHNKKYFDNQSNGSYVTSLSNMFKKCDRQIDNFIKQYNIYENDEPQSISCTKALAEAEKCLMGTIQKNEEIYDGSKTYNKPCYAERKRREKRYKGYIGKNDDLD